MKVLVTGASGFVGSALVRHLVTKGHQVDAASRTATGPMSDAVRTVPMRTLESGDPPLAAECHADVVIHLAAMVHVTRNEERADLALFRKVNVDGSIRLARQARAWGAKRFIYISSVKVIGDESLPGRPFTAHSHPAPHDAYSLSKLEAEQALAPFCDAAGLELVVIRPPLVYGPGVKANFGRLVSAVRRGRPLPFGSLRNNRRSLVAVDNLVDLIGNCLDRPEAAGRSFLVSDDEDLSTAELIEHIAQAAGARARLYSVPEWALRFAGAISGREKVIQRLCGSLQVDISETKQVLKWSPPVKVAEALRGAVAEGQARAP